jgi:hypothetical protein
MRDGDYGEGTKSWEGEDAAGSAVDAGAVGGAEYLFPEGYGGRALVGSWR